MYTYDVQYVDFRWDQVKEMGEVGVDDAVNAFLSFPFKEQLDKADQMLGDDPNAEPTSPTISFRSESDDASLAVWAMDSDSYEVYFESQDKKVTVETNHSDFIVEAIKEFFSGSHADLFQRLSGERVAVTKNNEAPDGIVQPNENQEGAQTSLIDKLKSFFT